MNLYITVGNSNCETAKKEHFDIQKVYIVLFCTFKSELVFKFERNWLTLKLSLI